jgi:hypothetical protein
MTTGTTAPSDEIESDDRATYAFYDSRPALRLA